MITPIDIAYKRRCREYLDRVVPDWEIETSAINRSGLAYTADFEPPIDGRVAIQAPTLEALAKGVAALRKEKIPE